MFMDNNISIASLQIIWYQLLQASYCKPTYYKNLSKRKNLVNDVYVFHVPY